MADKRRKIDVALMLGAVALLIVGIPMGIWVSEKWNGWLSPTYDYASFPDDDNHTLDAPYNADLIDTTGLVYTVNGTGEDAVITNETVVWDTVLDWDSVTMTDAGILVVNLNKTVGAIYTGKDYQFRFTLNCSEDLEISLEAVKSDGVLMTVVPIVGPIESDGTGIIYWNLTPAEVLGIVTTLNALATEENWIRIVITGAEGADLDLGTTIEFKGELGGSGHVYAVSPQYTLQAVALVFTLVFGFVAVASTPYFNPLNKGGSFVKPGSRKGYRRK